MNELSLDSVEVHNGIDKWTLLTTVLPSGTRPFCTGVSFQDNFVVVGGSRSEIDVYDVTTETWSSIVIPEMIVERIRYSAGVVSLTY